MRAWLEARGVAVRYRASLEDDLAALMDVRPDLAIGTTPVVQKAKTLGIPALYFTNLISARPLMGVAGAGSPQDGRTGSVSPTSPSRTRCPRRSPGRLASGRGARSSC